MSGEVVVTLTRADKYKFLIDFGSGMPAVAADLGRPLGEGSGPSPEHLLAAAIGNCLSASLVFALQRYKEDPGPLSARVAVTTGRNADKRLRVASMAVTLTVGDAAANLPHLAEALARFEEFCTVTQSVRAGIPIEVKVVGPDGTAL